jgi:hypothetical protein
VPDVFRDVVVLIPGIMGSALAKDGQPVWDVTAGVLGRALGSFGGTIHGLAVADEPSVADGVTATHLLTDAHLIPGFWKIDGYSGLAAFVRSRLSVVPGENYFEFPYDWRLDNRVAAGRLRQAALGWLERWRSHPGHAGARLVLIAHSMGGLVSRYFLECLGGWRDTRMLVTLGTPFRGSVKALDFLVNGSRKTFAGFTLLDLTSVIRSLPSSYQLLPIYPCVGRTAHELARIEDLPELGALDMDRARAGVAFHREIQAAVESNRMNPAYLASPYRLLPLVGTYQPTFLSAVIAGDGIAPLRTYKGQTLLDGDGTVPRLSATPVDLSNAGRETFVACPHASLQNFDPARTQLRAALEDVDISEMKAVGLEPIGLDIDDGFAVSEPVRARARCATAVDPMQAVITDVATGATVTMPFEVDSADEEWHTVTVPPLPAGTYRIEVTADRDAEPVTDLFIVA